MEEQQGELTEKKLQRRLYLEQHSKSYRLIKTLTKWMDNYYLDPILGLIPTAGDLISATLVIPYLYVSLFKVRSVPLTLAILCNLLMDVAMGIIPFWIGDILDFFHKSYVRNYELIVGFVEGDKKIIHKVNKRALWMIFLIVLLCFLIYWLIKLASLLMTWLFGLLS